MSSMRTILLAALATGLATATVDALAAASCRGAAGVHPHGQIVAAPAIIGVVTWSVAVPAYRCTNGVWACVSQCGADIGATFVFRDGRLQRAPARSR